MCACVFLMSRSVLVSFSVQEGEILNGVGGRNVEVTEVIHHPSEDRKLVFIHAAGNGLIVTSDHRIVVPRGTEHKTIPAGHLKKKTLFCSDGEHNLIEVKHVTANVSVYQLSFWPDVPLETFYERHDAGFQTKAPNTDKELHDEVA